MFKKVERFFKKLCDTVLSCRVQSAFRYIYLNVTNCREYAFYSTLFTLALAEHRSKYNCEPHTTKCNHCFALQSLHAFTSCLLRIDAIEIVILLTLLCCCCWCHSYNLRSNLNLCNWKLPSLWLCCVTSSNETRFLNWSPYSVHRWRVFKKFLFSMKNHS